ncbi:MAG: filamentous hemagglutinin N-terminal domain-containing protein, partial [Nitrospirales bacterium]
YGTIQTTDFGNANLFLINPSGIVFGPNGSVNVGGSVSFSTAQYLRLSDGVGSANFYANPASDGLANSILVVDPVVNFGFLSSAVPAAYGFLGAPDSSATITVQGSALSVPSGRSISLVGGKVVIEGEGRLSAPSGRIHLAATASPGGEFATLPGESLAHATSLRSVPNNPVDPASAASFTSYGLVSMAPGSSIDLSGTNTVWVKGGQLVLSVNDATLSTSENSIPSDTVSLSQGSSIVTSNSGAEPGADVEITVGNLQMDGASITSVTTGNGKGGNISITNAQTVNLTNGAQIVSRTDGLGDGGNITASATDTIFISGFDTTGALSGVTTTFFDPNFGLPLVTSGVFSTVSSSGNGGQISIAAPTVTLENAATLATITYGGGGGGDLTLNVRTLTLRLGSGDFGMGALMLSSSGEDLSTFFPTGTGQGGIMTVQGLLPDSAAESVTLNGGAITAQTFGPGRGGDILITSDAVQLDTKARIESSTSELIDVVNPGASGDISLNVNKLKFMDFSTISNSSATFSPGFGEGGDVTIQGLPVLGVNSETDPPPVAESVHLSSSSGVGTLTFGNGEGGLVMIRSESLVVEGDSTINTSTFETGPGGDIVVSVKEAHLLSGGTIRSNTELASSDAGAGGKVTVQGLDGDGTKADSLILEGRGSGIFSSSSGTGDLGNIEAHAETVSLKNNAVIQVGTTQDAAQTAGNVFIDADWVRISGGSRIASQVFAAKAGEVTIKADQLTLENGSIETSTSGLGQAGDVVLNVGSISLINGSLITSASTGIDPIINANDGTTQPPGQAGNITITAMGSFTSDASSIATSAEANHGGDISVTTQSVELSNGTLITANSKAPLVVTKLVLDQGGLPVEVEAVGDDGRSDGNAGNLTITSASNVVMQNSSVTTEASAASGGDIEIHASDTGMIQLANSRVSTSVGGLANVSDGGNIMIDPQFVILQNTQIRANAVEGAGGAIDIIATSAFIADPNSSVNASSTRGISGTVNIQSPLQNVGGELTALSDEFSSAAALLAQQCAARAAGGTFSTFVVAAREGLPVEPGGFLASPSLTAELLGSHLSGRYPHAPIAAVTGLFPKYDARPIQLAKLGNACHQ